jgi:hypothetical protein
MGFNKAAKREAAAQQAAAYAQQQAQFGEAQRQAREYQQSFNTRNAGIINLRDTGNAWLGKYGRGVDINELLPAQVALGQQASDTVKATVAAQGRMGDASQLPNDAGYHDKLNHVMGARLGKGMAAINADYLNSEHQGVKEDVFNATQLLNQDSQAGLGLNNQLFGMTESIWNNATTRRKMEIEVAQQSMGNLMGLVQMGVGAASGFLGAFTSGRGQAGTAGGSGGPMSNSAGAGFGGGIYQQGWGNAMARSTGRNPFGY